MSTPRSGATPYIAVGLIVAALLLGGAGMTIFFTERGVANEIKGFVLLLIAALLGVGGVVLWELQSIRRLLERRDR